MNAIDIIPSRIKYYLLEWKDDNMIEYINKYGERKLRDLELNDLIKLFNTATTEDATRLVSDLINDDRNAT